jgi:hypothetical protein
LQPIRFLTLGSRRPAFGLARPVIAGVYSIILICPSSDRDNIIGQLEGATNALVLRGCTLTSARKTAIRYIGSGVPHEGACLGVCVAHICCRHHLAPRILCPDLDGRRPDDVTRHLDLDASDYHHKEEEVQITSREKEIKEIFDGSDQLSEAETFTARY